MTWIPEGVALAMAYVALRRSRRADALAQRVEILEQQLAALCPAAIGAEGAPLSPQAADVMVAPEGDALAAPPAGESVSAEPVNETGGVSPLSAPLPPPAVLPAAADFDPPPSRSAAPPRPPVMPTPPRGAPLGGIDWEQWLGVRGAAVLGGIVLALAGLFFFRYSIEHGLLPPWLRVVLGTLVGVSCLGASERYLRRDYAGTANALVGAGVVILYAAFWAAHGLYGLVGAPVSFVLMAMVTATCATLSWRQNSVVIAMIGLVGGFLTPLLLSSGSDRPIALFSYVLLLDLGLLYLARQRRWAILSLVGFGATFFYLAAWVLLRMGPQRLGLGLILTSLFSAVFLLAPSPGEDERRHWMLSRIGGALLPFFFGLHFALDARLGPHLFPIVVSMLPLAVAACWLSESHRRWPLGFAAAAATLGVVAAWLTTRRLDTGLAWEVALLLVVLAGVFHAFAERGRADTASATALQVATVAAAGAFTLLVGTALAHGRIVVWPWLFGWVGTATLLMRQGTFAGRQRLQPAVGAALALSLAATQVHAGVGFPGSRPYLALVVGLACVLQYIAVRRSPLHAGEASERAALSFAVVASLSLVGLSVAHTPPLLPVLLGAAALGLLAALAATRAGAARWYAAAMLTTALVQGVAIEITAGGADAALGLSVLATAFAAAALFTAWPLYAAPRLRDSRLTWYTAAFALPLWFWALRRIFVAHFDDGAIGILPIALGALTLAAAMRARAVLAADERMRSEAFAWFVVVTLGFAAVAIPLQLDKEWITLGWALEGGAAIWLWHRYDLPALKYFGLALLGAATVRLVGNPAVLGYYPRPHLRIVNWLAYTYLIPAACLLWSGALLAPVEVERARHSERQIYVAGQPVGAIFAALAGLIVIFVWLNLAIADWFSTGPTLTVSFARLPARDLTTSVVWAVYALGLLAAGVRLSSRGLRWASLALLSVTLAKVFLYDVGELRDLYRVASLLGLAVSLLIVSLVYQRFVLRVAEKG